MNNSMLMVMSADGTNRKEIAQTSSSNYLVWSPDGEWIAQSTPNALNAIHVATGEIVRIASGGNYYVFYSWRPRA